MGDHTWTVSLLFLSHTVCDMHSMHLMRVTSVVCHTVSVMSGDVTCVSHASITAASLSSLGLPPNEVHSARVLRYLCDLLVDKELVKMHACMNTTRSVLQTVVCLPVLPVYQCSARQLPFCASFLMQYGGCEGQL